MGTISVQAEPFDSAAELQAVHSGNPRIGALVSFLGLMRDFNAGETVSGLYLEHYPGMTEKSLAAVVAEAEARWKLEEVRVVHRVGELHPQDPIVLVAVASCHRGDAFRACEFIIDALKTRTPFWKKEITSQGDRWVMARPSDGAAEAHWRETSLASSP